MFLPGEWDRRFEALQLAFQPERPLVGSFHMRRHHGAGRDERASRPTKGRGPKPECLERGRANVVRAPIDAEQQPVGLSRGDQVAATTRAGSAIAVMVFHVQADRFEITKDIALGAEKQIISNHSASPLFLPNTPRASIQRAALVRNPHRHRGCRRYSPNALGLMISLILPSLQGLRSSCQRYFRSAISNILSSSSSK